MFISDDKGEILVVAALAAGAGAGRARAVVRVVLEAVLVVRAVGGREVAGAELGPLLGVQLRVRLRDGLQQRALGERLEPAHPLVRLPGPAGRGARGGGHEAVLLVQSLDVLQELGGARARARRGGGGGGGGGRGGRQQHGDLGVLKSGQGHVLVVRMWLHLLLLLLCKLQG